MKWLWQKAAKQLAFHLHEMDLKPISEKLLQKLHLQRFEERKEKNKLIRNKYYLSKMFQWKNIQNSIQKKALISREN